jgi:hypothetical protein
VAGWSSAGTKDARLRFLVGDLSLEGEGGGCGAVRPFEVSSECFCERVVRAI